MKMKEFGLRRGAYDPDAPLGSRQCLKPYLPNFGMIHQTIVEVSLNVAFSIEMD